MESDPFPSIWRKRLIFRSLSERVTVQRGPMYKHVWGYVASTFSRDVYRRTDFCRAVPVARPRRYSDVTKIVFPELHCSLPTHHFRPTNAVFYFLVFTNKPWHLDTRTNVRPSVTTSRFARRFRSGRREKRRTRGTDKTSRIRYVRRVNTCKTACAAGSTSLPPGVLLVRVAGQERGKRVKKGKKREKKKPPYKPKSTPHLVNAVDQLGDLFGLHLDVCVCAYTDGVDFVDARSRALARSEKCHMRVVGRGGPVPGPRGSVDGRASET